MAAKVWIGLVGCGFFSRNHLHSWKDLAAEGAELVAVCDIDPGKAEAAAREFGVPHWYSDLDAMLDREKIRPSRHRHAHGHASHARREGDRRRHRNDLQKPFAPNWDDAVAMTKAAERAGVFLAVHENFRFQTPLPPRARDHPLR